MEPLSGMIVSPSRRSWVSDSRLTSPRDPSALLGEVPLPLSFCGAPPAILWILLRLGFLTSFTVVLYHSVLWFSHYVYHEGQLFF